MTSRRARRPSLRKEHQLSRRGSTYTVWAASAKVKRAFDGLADELQLQSLVELLSAEPLRRVPGKTKKLKGRLDGVLQYDLPDGNRAQYVVIDHDVILLYVGRHPKAGG